LEAGSIVQVFDAKVQQFVWFGVALLAMAVIAWIVI
jgi:hypothetical protein